jgi:diguanylate cyclase (GGDEF)-like protein/PAS domain S-box-containing protein
MKEIAILCVDDESTILHAITAEIRSMVDDSIIIESALNADEALEVCEELKEDNIEIALVISDCIMPGMQGDKLLEKIHEIYPEAYKMMLTGQSELEAIKYAINYANLFRYLTKPWDKNDMLLTVQSAIHGYQNNQELNSYKKDLESKVAQRTLELREAMNTVHEYALYTLIDATGTILETSESFALICGIEVEELIGKSLFDTISNKSSENTIKNIKKALLNKEKFECEVLHQFVEYKSTWTDIIITPNIKDDEEITFIIKRHDISDKKHIEELCDTDVLTSLYNRRFFNSLFPKELQRIIRDKLSFAFLMVDVDNFKKYNDTYGHQKGDDALCVVSSVLKNITQRGNDFAFRVGGEEFAIITSNISKAKLELFANSINDKLYKKAIPHKTNGVSPYLSTSIGVVFYENGQILDDMDTIIKKADDLLYKAKENGRNQVVIKVQ